MRIKMKCAMILVMVLLAQSCLNDKAEKVENDWTRDELQGKVMSYSEFSYKAIERLGNIEKGKREREYDSEYDVLRKYDKKGNKIEDDWYNSDGILKHRYTYEYDEKGCLIEVNKYNSEGSIDCKLSSLCIYDDKGNKVEEKWNNSDGSLYSKDTYKYDNKGNIIEDNSYKSCGVLYCKYTCEYDDEGNKIEDNWYNSEGILKHRYTYKYDEKGYNIEENRYSNGILATHKKYDDKGNKIEGNEYFEGNLFYRYIYKYDDEGNKIEESWYNSEGSLYSKYTYEIELDKEGNWIKKIVFKDEKPAFILERKIEYYN